MKLDRKQDLDVLYQVCVFCADRKNKMAALASDWLRHFRLLLLKLLIGIQRNLTGSHFAMFACKAYGKPNCNKLTSNSIKERSDLIGEISN